MGGDRRYRTGVGETTTNADGAFVIPNLWAEPGENLYKVSFFHGSTGEFQYAFRKRTLTEADYVQVQWVGPNGGTGGHLLAKTIKATAGQTATTSPILLDGAGSISGSVVDSRTGAPVASVCAFPRAGYADWPVHFVDNIGPYAWQWSGDQPSQLTARQIKVQVGQSVTENAHLGRGTTVSGNVKTNGVNGNYQFPNIAGNQPMKIVYNDWEKPPYHEYWYKEATTFGSARPILVRASSATTGIDFVITPR